MSMLACLEMLRVIHKRLPSRGCEHRQSKEIQNFGVLLFWCQIIPLIVYGVRELQKWTNLDIGRGFHFTTQMFEKKTNTKDTYFYIKQKKHYFQALPDVHGVEGSLKSEGVKNIYYFARRY